FPAPRVLHTKEDAPALLARASGTSAATMIAARRRCAGRGECLSQITMASLPVRPLWTFLGRTTARLRRTRRIALDGEISRPVGAFLCLTTVRSEIVTDVRRAVAEVVAPPSTSASSQLEAIARRV